MKRIVLGLAASAAAIAMAPVANAAPLLNGATGTAFTAFAGPSGTLLTSTSVAVAPATFTGTLRAAVYQNAAGTLDFYYQVAISTIMATDEVVNLSAFNFAGYAVDAQFLTTDFDGAGIFTAANNPGGFMSTASRNAAGGTVRADFNGNGLVAGETSAVYIFRTNATQWTTGTFTAQDGSTITVPAFAPVGPAVPEPATWGLMLLGFGAMGGMLRSRRRATARIRFA